MRRMKTILALAFVLLICGCSARAGNVIGWGLNAYDESTPPSDNDFVSISAGAFHSLGLKTNGTVVGWGSNFNESHYNSEQATPPPGLGNVVEISAGKYHSLALKSDGTIVAWGDNSGGQVSNAPAGGNFRAIAAGACHNLAMKTYSIYGWGDNRWGQAEIAYAPYPLRFAAVSAGERHSLALLSDGSIIGWGDNSCGQLTGIPIGGDFKAIAAGAYHSLALRADGTVIGWGSNEHGECTPPAGLTRVTAISAGNWHSLALKSDGTIVGWGANWYLAPIDLCSCAQALPPSGVPGFTRISAGGDHSLAIYPCAQNIHLAIHSPEARKSYLTTDASIPVSYTVTDDVDPQPTGTVYLDGTIYTKQNIAPLYNMGGYHTITVVAKDSSGNTSIQSSTFKVSSPPPPPPYIYIESPQARTYYKTDQPISVHYTVQDFDYYSNFPDPVATVQLDGLYFCGTSVDPSTLSRGKHNLEVTAQGYGGTSRQSVTFTIVEVQQIDKVVGWGRNQYDQALPPPGLRDIVAVSAGTEYSLALMSDGTALGWGRNTYGQAAPPQGLDDAVAISAGGFHSLALESNGMVAGWGYDDYGEACPPAGLRRNIAIGAGEYHSLSLDSDGTVIAWGRNDYGQATPPPGLADVVGIAAGSYHSLALRSDGTVVGWGDNYRGKAAPPQGLSQVIAIAAGGSHSLALKSDGTVVGWGSDNHHECDPPQGLTDVTAIAASEGYSLALTRTGDVIAWGDNYWGINPPPGLNKVVAISAGSSHCLALRDITPPNTTVLSPQAVKGYCVTGKPIPIHYTMVDDFDHQPQAILTLDGKSFSGTEITVSGLAPGDHALQVTASDRFQNTSTQSVTFTVIAAPTIPDAKTGADGLPVNIVGAIVSAAFPDVFYIESGSRVCGIRVNKPGHALQAGMRADVVGVTATSDAERCIDASDAHISDPPNDGGSVGPLGLPNASLGGGTFGAQAGVWGWANTIGSDGKHVRVWQQVSGPNNIGLLVKTWGKFVRTGDHTFTLDDGSGVIVDCIAPSDMALNPEWTYAIVTGISSCKTVGAEVHRLLLVPSSDDVLTF
jgi:alpha-tubulin suppressor-like RCC1 family protein